jgi:rod shape-determining protein MreD
MRVFLVILFLLIFVALQVSLGDTIAIKGITPHLVLLFVFFIAFSFGERYGMWVGFLGGLFCDIYDPQFFGLNMTLFLVVGFVMGSAHTKFYSGNIFVSIIIFSFVLLLYEIAYSILIWQFTFGNLMFNLVRYGIPRVIYTSIVAFILFPLLSKIPPLATKR